MSLVRKNGSDLVSGQERQEGMRVEQGIEKWLKKRVKFLYVVNYICYKIFALAVAIFLQETDPSLNQALGLERSVLHY